MTCAPNCIYVFIQRNLLKLIFRESFLGSLPRVNLEVHQPIGFHYFKFDIFKKGNKILSNYIMFLK